MYRKRSSGTRKNLASNSISPTASRRRTPALGGASAARARPPSSALWPGFGSESDRSPPHDKADRQAASKSVAEARSQFAVYSAVFDTERSLGEQLAAEMSNLFQFNS